MFKNKKLITPVILAVAATLAMTAAIAGGAQSPAKAEKQRYVEFGPLDQLSSGQNPEELAEDTGLRPDDDKKQDKATAESAPSGPVAGVSQSTLDAIAACESGGDPTAVNAAGYYGKYQFDTGTWASVGGTGNPAEASEGEQDYRASLLYQRAGATPWPVCGQ